MSTNRYIDKLKARLAKEADQRMQLQALLDDQVARNRALLAERDAYRKALEKLANVPGCGCSFPCRCGGEEWTRAELEGRMDYAAETLAHAALQGAQP